MTKKLEEEFNLPPIEEINIPLDDEEATEVDSMSLTEVQAEIEKTQGTMSVVDRADISLSTVVTGLETVEHEMDEYAKRAMDTFDELVDLGKSVEDRNAAPIYDSASKMLTAALQAKQSKLDRKVKMIELQQRQAKIELETKKLEHQIAKDNNKLEDAPEVTGQVVADRATILAEMMAKMKESNK